MSKITTIGIPTGGSTDQILKKKSNNNYDVEWSTPAGGGGSGTVTSITAGTGLAGGVITTSGTVSHGNTSSQASVNNSNGTVIQDITLDTFGHVTSLGSYDLDLRYYTETEVNNLLTGYVPSTRTITINGTSYDLSANRTWSVGTVTSVGITAGTGINVSGSPIIGSGSITVTNSAPDQTVVLTAGSGISISGTYPSFTITNTGSSGITGSGTSGYVTYWDGTSSITGESNLFWDATNDRLGIKQASPAYNLDVNGTGRFTGDLRSDGYYRDYQGEALLYTSTGAVTQLGSLGAGTPRTVQILAGNAVRATFDTSGNLGLGVTPSAWGSPFKALEGGDGDNQQYLAFQTNANDLKIGTNNYYDGANYVYKFNGTATRYDVSNSSFAWNLAGSGTAGNTISFTQAMTLNASGQLAIGTTSNAWGSSFKSIQIGTGLSALSDSNGRATYLSNNWYYDTGDKYMAAYQATLYYQYLGAHAWLTAGTGSAGAALTWTQAMTLDSSGRLGIGSSATSPTATLQIGTGIGTFDGLSIGGAANRDIRIGQSSTNNLVLAWKYNATAASAYALIETFGGSNNLILQGTGGNVGIGTTSPSQKLHVETSDQIVFLGRSTQASGYSSLRLYNDQNNALRALEIDYFGSTASGGERAEIFVTGAYPLAFGTSNTERMRITSGGNVGINTTTPDDKLDVNGGNSGAATFRNTYLFGNDNYAIRIVGDTSKYGYISQYVNDGNLVLASGMRYYGAGPWTPDSTTAESIQLYNGDIYFTTNAGLTAGVNFTPTERMRITSGGKVGIANTNPTLQLHVNGGAIFGPNSNSGVYISPTNENTINSGYGTDDDTRDLWLNYRGYQDGFTRFRDVRVGNGKGSVIAFFQGSTSRLGVGTENPSAKLVVEDGVANQTGAPTYRGSMIISNGGGTTSTSGGLEFHAASSGSGYGWRISTPDLGFGNIPMIFQHRNNSTSWTELIRIKYSSGNYLFGIGTTSPISPLHVITESGGVGISVENIVGSYPSAIRFISTTSPSPHHYDIGASGDEDSFGLRRSLSYLFKFTSTGQFKLNNYTTTTSFTGTAVGYLAYDSGGNILTKSGITTSIGETTFTQNIGNSVNENSTFGGYTLQQVVKALIDLGILS